MTISFLFLVVGLCQGLEPVERMSVWPFAPPGLCDMKLSSSEDSPVATRLEGNWTFQLQLTEHLKTGGPAGEGRDENQGQAPYTVSFTNDSEVLRKLPQDRCFYIQQSNNKVYLSGTFTITHAVLGAQDHPYVLTSHQGSPVIAFWSGTDPRTNAMFVQMARSLNSDNDLLILGEDRLDKPFGVLNRVGTGTKNIFETQNSLQKKKGEDKTLPFDVDAFIAAVGDDVKVY